MIALFFFLAGLVGGAGQDNYFNWLNKIARSMGAGCLFLQEGTEHPFVP
jgi:hypothetical protein